MTSPRFTNFNEAINFTKELLQHQSDRVAGKSWQSIDVSKYGELMHMRELFNHGWTVELSYQESLEHWQSDIEPNSPWANTAFEERVSGLPWNPGKAWESWPWARSAEQFKPERFSHSYAERYWPKLATNAITDQNRIEHHAMAIDTLKGIRYLYGDLMDVVNHLFKDPYSRQAYLPMWFPEDTGVVHGERVPCSLGYHFLYREGKFHITYYIRSCDFVRHYRDDIYMTLRLLLWVLNELKDLEAITFPEIPLWRSAVPGDFVFHCVSMHCFENDWRNLFG